MGFARRHARHHATPMDADARAQAMLLALDTYAVAHYARARRIGGAAVDAAMGGAPGACAVWGGRGPTDAPAAAFLNGAAAEALDFQEVLIDGRNNGHAAVVIVPALAALAAEAGADAEVLLAGLRTALVANVALARALGRGHRAGHMGFRTTALVAPIAAALGGALTVGAGADRAAAAAALAASTLPAGLLAAMSPEAGAFTADKDLSVGFSARHAVDAVRLAQTGATGPLTVLDGPRGWLPTYGQGTEDAAHLETPPDDAVLAQYALKLYPANFGCQCAIRLALDLRAEIPPARIAAVEVRVKASSAQSLSARTIPSHVAARFSLPYAVASAMLRGRSVLADFEGAALADPEVHAFMERIALVGDDALEAQHRAEGVFPAVLTVTDTEGGRHVRRLTAPQEAQSEDRRRADVDAKIRSLLPAPLADAMLAAYARSDFAAMIDHIQTPTEDTDLCAP
ncbi:hypothetical protein DXV76_02510 [Rhodobacteraceae bacterium CCMM004]|nr:hypothetical protein DXV76_02510 [Rhodobacteraceae bacterium CCMM004]